MASDPDGGLRKPDCLSADDFERACWYEIRNHFSGFRSSLLWGERNPSSLRSSWSGGLRLVWNPNLDWRCSDL